MRGDWRQHEVWDGTYTLDDLTEWHRMTAVKVENERRMNEWHEQQANLRRQYS